MKSVVLAVAVMLVCGIASAEETSLANGHPCPWHPHTHTYTDNYEPDTDTWRPEAYIEQRRDPLGAGLDLILFENESGTMSFTSENKYDFGNDEYSTFGVVTLNVWKMFNQ